MARKIIFNPLSGKFDYIDDTDTVAVWGSITGTLSAQTDLQTALDAKQATLVSGTNIKTVNGSSLLGSGDLTISGSSGTVTSVSVVTNQGVSGSVATATTTPAITLSLGALTEVTSFNGLVVTANTGVITTGTWNGSLITGTYGGTGVNNGTKTLTYLKDISLTSADDTGVYTLPTGTKTLLATDGAGTSLTGIPYTLTGTANQVVLSAGTGNITFSLPQSIATGSTVQFAAIELSHATQNTLTASSGILSIEGVAIPTISSIDELTNKTLNASVGKGTWTASGTWTLPALTLGGIVSGGGNQINNVIIGTVTPLAGIFTTLTAGSASSLTLGTASSAAGAVIYKNATNANTVTIQSGVTSASYTLTLPTAVAAVTGYVLSSTDAGVLSWVAGGGMTNPMTTTGDMIYSSDGSGTPARLAIGAAGKILQGGSTPSWSGTVSDGEGLQLNNTGFVSAPLRIIPQGRLTLTTAVPITTADVTAATVLYYTPYMGDSIPLFDGTRWKLQTFTEKSIKLSDTQTCTTSMGSTNLTVADSSQFMRGMNITGTNIAPGATISSITSATVVVMSLGASGTGTQSNVFTLPLGKNYDVFYSQVNAKLQYSNSWTTDNGRADALALQNGINVNNAAINSADSNTIAAKTGLYLGTIRTTGTAGQTEDSYGGASQAGGHRYVWNNYNRVERAIGVIEGTNSWTYTTATWRQTNGASGNKVEYVQGLSEDPVKASGLQSVNNSSTANVAIGLGIDSTTVNSAQTFGAVVIGGSNSVVRFDYSGYPTIGYHAFNWLEISAASGSTAWRGDDGLTYNQFGMQAWLMG